MERDGTGRDGTGRGGRTYVGKGRVGRHENGPAVGANHLRGVRAMLVPGHVSASDTAPVSVETAGAQAVDVDRGEHLAAATAARLTRNRHAVVCHCYCSLSLSDRPTQNHRTDFLCTMHAEARRNYLVPS